MTDELLVRDEDTVRVLTLNRPQVLNAVNTSPRPGPASRAGDRGRRPGVRCILLTATGERAFCAGGDLKQEPVVRRDEGRQCPPRDHRRPAPAAGQAAPGRGERPRVRRWRRTAARLRHRRVCGARHVRAARGEPGVVPAGGGLVRLPRFVGPRRALQLILTGAPIGAATALEWGLVNEVVPSGHEFDAAMTLARTHRRQRASRCPAQQADGRGQRWAAPTPRCGGSTTPCSGKLARPGRGGGSARVRRGPGAGLDRPRTMTCGVAADVQPTSSDRTGASSGRASRRGMSGPRPSPSTGAAVVTNLSASRSASSGRCGLPGAVGHVHGEAPARPRAPGNPRTSARREASVELLVDGQPHPRTSRRRTGSVAQPPRTCARCRTSAPPRPGARC